jgi:hypothetical protein
MSLQLVVLSGPDKGKTFTLNVGRDLMLGRSAKAHLAASRGPMAAPRWSIARWKPKARPRIEGSVESAIRASRGEVRTPLPMRSPTRRREPKLPREVTAPHLPPEELALPRGSVGGSRSACVVSRARLEPQ